MDSKVAVVFGATGGIGLAVCNALRQRGCKANRKRGDLNDDSRDIVYRGNGRYRILLQVILTDILDEENGKKLASDAMGSCDGGTWHYKKCDVTKKDDIEETFRFAKTTSESQVTIVVNCAGIMDEYNWHLCVQVNIVGCILITRCAIEHMTTAEGGQGGCVVHFSSVADNCPIYSATKHAVLGLSRSYGTERHFKDHGVRFNCVCPGAVDTAMSTEKAMQNVLWPEAAVAMLGFMKRVTPDQVASVVMDLIANEELNGQAMVISHSQGVEQIKFPQVPFC